MLMPARGCGTGCTARVSHRAAGAQRRITTLQRLAPGECQHCIGSLRREGARRGRDIIALAIHGRIGAEAFDESQSVLPGSGRKHARATQLGELHGEAADSAGGGRRHDEALARRARCTV